jgi:hypothetical protein
MRREKGEERIFQEIISRSVSDLMKDPSLHIQEGQRTLNYKTENLENSKRSNS